MTAQAKPKETPFTPAWPDPDPRLLRAELPPAPELPLRDVLGPRLANWVADAAEAKGAPADYVFAAVLAVAGATIGNARWAAIWQGWTEPPVIWVMCIGLWRRRVGIGAPGHRQKIGFHQVRRPPEVLHRDCLRFLGPIGGPVEKGQHQRQPRGQTRKLAQEGQQQPFGPGFPAAHHRAEVIHQGAGVIREGDKPRAGFPGFIGRKVERQQPPQRRLHQRFIRPGLRASQGRGFGPDGQEAGQQPVIIGLEQEAFQAVGLNAAQHADGQPVDCQRFAAHALHSKTPAPESFQPERPVASAAGIALHPFQPSGQLVAHLQRAARLPGQKRPEPFNRAVIHHKARDMRGRPHIAAGRPIGGRLAVPDCRLRRFLPGRLRQLGQLGLFGPFLALGFRRFAKGAFGLPQRLQRRINGGAFPGAGQAERAARRLVGIVREQGWQRFTARDVLRLDRSGLGTAAELNPALAALEDGECIRPVDPPANPQGGRPQRLFLVNPALHGGQA